MVSCLKTLRVRVIIIRVRVIIKSYDFKGGSNYNNIIFCFPAFLISL